jgi:ubiquinone/menaquinone biosynthesis C-methylase UbiE
MSREILLREIEDLRASFIKYTRKAFQTLSTLDKPRILDVGCGSGAPTIELAKMSDGEVIAIDIDQSSLDKLGRKIEKERLSNRVKIINMSLFNLDFPEESFDVIWCEGAISPIGFERALKEWRRFLKVNGFMVLHDDINNKDNKLKFILECGYDLIEFFQLPDNAWWVQYYGPLEKRINDMLEKHSNHPEILGDLNRFQKEIDMYKRDPSAFRSIFYIMQKINTS